MNVNVNTEAFLIQTTVDIKKCIITIRGKCCIDQCSSTNHVSRENELMCTRVRVHNADHVLVCECIGAPVMGQR